MNPPPHRQPDPRTHRRWPRLALAFGVWATVLSLWVHYQTARHLGPAATTQRLIDAARGHWWAVGAYLLVALVRPPVLFPATLLTVAAGMLFGPGLGLVVAASAANASALVAYSIGRTLGPSSPRPPRLARLAGWTDRLRHHSFESVLLLRLLFAPYDVVNYGCGLLKIGRRPFLAATALGSLPGTVAFVLAGSSITHLDHRVPSLNTATIAASAALILASLGISRHVRRVTARTDTIDADTPGAR